MGLNFEIKNILKSKDFELSNRELYNLTQLFDYVNYLFDDEGNLTKTFNLVKKAREQLIQRIEEMFEDILINDRDQDGGA